MVRILVLVVIAGLVLTNCQKDVSPLVASQNDGQAITLNLRLDKPSGTNQSPLQNVTKVTVQVTGDGLDQPVVKVLTISANEARGTLTLPLGSKTFTITGSVVRGASVIDLFQGTKTQNISESTKTVEITLAPITGNQATLNWHDGSAEDFAFVTGIGGVLSMGFNANEPLFILGVEFFFRWQGNAGDYRIAIFDKNFNPLFISNNPIPPGVENDWNSWTLVWDTPSNGVINAGDDVFVGFSYESDMGWPEVGYDLTNPSGNSVFFDPAQQGWFADSNGDYLITATLQTQGGQKLFVTPNRVFHSKLEYDNWKHHVTEKQR